ncbi:MAG: hypothetical protein IPK83_22935 [Planctomycetes bacterium]|nr:hypothetical protein [Planctomycetota bacterium]
MEGAAKKQNAMSDRRIWRWMRHVVDMGDLRKLSLPETDETPAGLHGECHRLRDILGNGVSEWNTQ